MGQSEGLEYFLQFLSDGSDAAQQELWLKKLFKSVCAGGAEVRGGRQGSRKGSKRRKSLNESFPFPEQHYINPFAKAIIGFYIYVHLYQV